MTEPHKRLHRPSTYKTAYRVKHWRQYDQSLRDRGDITLWRSQDALDAWTPPMIGTRGAQPVYSDLAIETALTLRLLIRLPRRQTAGLLGAVLQRMDLTLPCPDHTTLSRRNATVGMRQQVARAPQGPISRTVDRSGLQVCGHGGWHAQQHGEKKPKRWKKLTIGVDAQGHIVASAVTESHAQDPSHVPELLAQIAREIGRFIGDGMYDKAPVSAAVSQHSPGARAIIPPRKDTVLRHTGTTAPTPRDQHLLAIKSAGRCAWKRRSGYYDQAYAEHAFSRGKRPFGDRLRAKRDASQEREASLVCQLLNRMLELGRPQSCPVS